MVDGAGEGGQAGERAGVASPPPDVTCAQQTRPARCCCCCVSRQTTFTRPPTPAPQRTDWVALTPRWEHYAAVIEGDEGMRKELGWVREMYGFSAALAELKLVERMDIKPPATTKLIAQLPIDHTLGEAHAFHYTQARGRGRGGRQGGGRQAEGGCG